MSTLFAVRARVVRVGLKLVVVTWPAATALVTAARRWCVGHATCPGAQRTPPAPRSRRGGEGDPLYLAQDCPRKALLTRGRPPCLQKEGQGLQFLNTSFWCFAVAFVPQGYKKKTSSVNSYGGDGDELRIDQRSTRNARCLLRV